MADNRFIIITGVSGSGKTIFSRFLEDFGYYCMDNLPVKLIPAFVDLWKRKEVEIEKVALVVDIRESGFTSEFPEVLKSIQKDVSPRLIFLEASDETLVKRFSESRRPHPLMEKGSVVDNIRLERNRLENIKKLADEVIDTSLTSIPELKKLLAKKFVDNRAGKMQVMIISFGYKYGIPLDSDLVFDTRFLANPFYVDTLRDKDGRDDDVKKFIFKSTRSRKYREKLLRFVDFLIPHFIEEGKSYLTISIGCTGGRHRSVAFAEELKIFLLSRNYNARVTHRDVFK
ncbi:MAG: RNase adapter RapZ [Candidatus Aminicenantes bacterium]